MWMFILLFFVCREEKYVDLQLPQGSTSYMPAYQSNTYRDRDRDRYAVKQEPGTAIKREPGTTAEPTPAEEEPPVPAKRFKEKTVTSLTVDPSIPSTFKKRTFGNAKRNARQRTDDD